MPSWKLPLLMPFKSSSKQSSTTSSSSSAISTSSHSSSRSHSPIILTPSSSNICLSSVQQQQQQQQQTATQSNPKTNTQTGRRLRRKNRKTVDTPPKPVQPRLSSLFFPTTDLTPEQETKCSYKASFAASLSDLLSPSLGRSGGRRPASEYWNGEVVKEAEASSFELRSDFEYKQSNLTSPVLGLDLDLDTFPNTPPASFPPVNTIESTRPYRSSLHFTQSVDNLGFSNSTIPNVRFSLRDPYLVLAPLSSGQHRVSRKSVDYSDMSARKERSYSTSGGARLSEIERGTEIWSSPYDSDLDLPSNLQMAAPPVPARSNLRPTASTSNLRDRFSKTGQSSNSTPFTSPIDQSSSRTGLSAFTSSRSQEIPNPTTPPMNTSPSMESTFHIGRRKRPSAGRGGSISGDPMRIKDGATSRESASGVYTPPTFPGVQGYQNPKPREPSSKIYTPSTFNLPSPSLHRPPASPSRSTSISSTSTASSFGEVTTPRTPHTPLTPGSRFLGAVSGGWGSAVTGIKRASATLTTRSLTSPSATSTHSYTPTSAREGYFPSTIYESSNGTATSGVATPLAPSLWPITPGTGRKSYGLGLGIGSESENVEGKNSRPESEKFGAALVGDVPKGKRKPVPKPVRSEGIKEEGGDEREVEVEMIHAM